MTDVARNEEYALVIDELNHRLRNIFGLVDVIASQTLKGNLEDATRIFRARLAALAAASAPGGKDPTVQALLDRELGPYAGQVIVHPCRSVALQPIAAQHLALIIHELATNALKHGALSVPGGRVVVTTSVEANGGGPRFLLSWVEQDGPAVAPPASVGFGSRVLQRAAHYAGADVSLVYTREGLRYRYAIDLSKLTDKAA